MLKLEHSFISEKTITISRHVSFERSPV